MSVDNPDRFGYPRGSGYRREDYELCPLATNAEKLSCAGTCPLCGGYGEIPIARGDRLTEPQ